MKNLSIICITVLLAVSVAGSALAAGFPQQGTSKSFRGKVIYVPPARPARIPPRPAPPRPPAPRPAAPHR